MLRGVRGAITVSQNQAQAIRDAVAELIETLLAQNTITTDGIVSVFFTVTPDLTALNPARAIRESRADWRQVPMLCAQEAVIDGMLPRCIRVLIQWQAADGSPPPMPAYLGEARGLRPDL